MDIHILTEKEKVPHAHACTLHSLEAYLGVGLNSSHYGALKVLEALGGLHGVPRLWFLERVNSQPTRNN